MKLNVNRHPSCAVTHHQSKTFTVKEASSSEGDKSPKHLIRAALVKARTFVFDPRGFISQRGKYCLHRRGLHCRNWFPPFWLRRRAHRSSPVTEEATSTNRPERWASWAIVGCVVQPCWAWWSHASAWWDLKEFYDLAVNPMPPMSPFIDAAAPALFSSLSVFVLLPWQIRKPSCCADTTENQWFYKREAAENVFGGEINSPERTLKVSLKHGARRRQGWETEEDGCITWIYPQTMFQHRCD